MTVNKLRAKGTAYVETEEASGISYIILKVGPFKDRRAALRKLTAMVDGAKASKKI